MNQKLEEELEKVIETEESQKKFMNYVVRFGKWLLFVLPIILVIITILTIVLIEEIPEATKWIDSPVDYKILTILYVIVLAIYFFNSLILIITSRRTNKSLELRLDYEKRKGRPIDSLDGFRLVMDNINRVLILMNITALISIASVTLFAIMLTIGNVELSYIAMGTTLVGLGLALLIRTVNFNITDVNGLQEFFEPLTHSILLDNFFTEVFSNHLDPVTYLKWDDYILGIEDILTEEFVQLISEKEKEELPITFAIEKILFLYYLKYLDVLTEEQFIQEFKEVVDLDSKDFDIQDGYCIEKKWVFAKKHMYKIFKFIKKHNPEFFTIIDRLQLELVDNIERIANDPIYFDSSANEVVNLHSELNVMIILYNNRPEPRDYRIRVYAPGFEPKKVSLGIEVEGRGSFKIPSENIPLVSDGRLDITQVLSMILENADTVWLTLEPIKKGEQTIQIFIETTDGHIVGGETRTIKVKTNIKDYIKKLSSLGSVVSGIAVALSRAIF
ncbi:MAG: hypothetical protein ACQERB_10645 [Promethearchaeati archaeon]